MAAVGFLVLLFATLCAATSRPPFFMDSKYCQFTQTQINAYEKCFESVVGKPATAQNAKDLTPEQHYKLALCVDTELEIVTGSTYNLNEALANIEDYATNANTESELKDANIQCATLHKDVESFVKCLDVAFFAYCKPGQ